MRHLRVKVGPNARRAALTEQADGTWLAEVQASPVNGKANDALIALVADHFGLRRSQVEIRSGAGSRYKQLSLAD